MTVGRRVREALLIKHILLFKLTVQRKAGGLRCRLGERRLLWQLTSITRRGLTGGRENCLITLQVVRKVSVGRPGCDINVVRRFAVLIISCVARALLVRATIRSLRLSRRIRVVSFGR